METFKCSKCHQEKPVNHSGGTGYGINQHGEKTCYACIGEMDKTDLINAELGEKFIHYLSKDETGYYVGNWPGTWKHRLHTVKKGRHNIAGSRYDFWFQLKNRFFHGVQYGEFTQIAHLRCVKPF